VVRRACDADTQAVVEQCAHCDLVDVVVSKTGVLAAMGAGVAAAQGEIVAFIDDDAVPRPDWLQRLVRHFDDPRVGGVGGRDLIAHPDSPNILTLDVGRVSPWGKLIGNHHRGTGEARKVMVLKAVGIAFRRSALTLPDGLRGAGAQAHFEVGMCLSALRHGWDLIYDPTAIVDHYGAPRFDADRRGSPHPRAVRDAAFNLVTCLLAEAPDLFWRRALYGLMIGDGATPGLVRATAALLRRERKVLNNVRPSLEGQIDALWHAYRRSDLYSARHRRTGAEWTRIASLAHDNHRKVDRRRLRPTRARRQDASTPPTPARR
jgi:cellulose synthase/poly-beta-1,6-N-acetylglucosamine synthase-like glycosyltransferase